jgi:hypothetical protein
MGAIKWPSRRAREASPLWVWLALALLACGTIVYVTTVSIIEYFIAAS